MLWPFHIPTCHSLSSCAYYLICNHPQAHFLVLSNFWHWNVLVYIWPKFLKLPFWTIFFFFCALREGRQQLATIPYTRLLHKPPDHPFLTRDALYKILKKSVLRNVTWPVVLSWSYLKPAELGSARPSPRYNYSLKENAICAAFHWPTSWPCTGANLQVALSPIRHA